MPYHYDLVTLWWYEWCDNACSNGSNWNKTSVGVPDEEGIGSDLELDSAGRPRMAFLTSSELGYTWCNGNCATPVQVAHVEISLSA